MKSMFNKKFVLISLITVLLIGTGIATTLAYLRSTPDELTNTFTIGNVTTEIVETEFRQDPSDSHVILKNPSVKNVGANDCFVRARVVCTPSDAVKEYIGTDSTKWVLGINDDFLYYYKSITPGEVTEPIFTKLTVSETAESLEITVYQEAVQTRVYAKDGSYTDDPATIWKWYDEGKIPDTFNATE